MSVTVWRIVRAEHSETAFSGEGNRLKSGRRNVAGIPMVYTSESIPLAVLEVRVNLTKDQLWSTFRLIGAAIPETLIRTIAPNRLPKHWQKAEYPENVPRFGTRWFLAGSSCVLRVPSVVVPQAFNYLINPTHPDFGRIEIGRPTKFRFDPRLFG